MRLAPNLNFDGFTDPPENTKNVSQYPKLAEELEIAEFSSSDLEMIFTKNALRIIEQGRGKTNETRFINKNRSYFIAHIPSAVNK